MTTKEPWMIKGREWLRTLDMFDDEELSQFEKNMKADLESLLKEKQDADQECRIKVGNGFLVSQHANANRKGTNYIRILDANKIEIAYWDSVEWAEDPEVVMGAIMGALCSLLGPDKKP
jgi:hypothetical protein